MDTNRLTLYAGGSPGRMGLQLRGPCATIADAQELEQRLRRLLSTGITILWIDCRQLSYLNRTGQRALLNTERYARTWGLRCFGAG
ncbi:hypothetical protein [Hymenobacter sp. AT01-02]|uniref:hypothetical protein n=1 Tax=Hymenobacter sp. AT01-02 TaxID=1571877 RepID=UPI000AA46F9B|nr:hypothetical protein [Hymenobacter sp. AT01-02]